MQRSEASRYWASFIFSLAPDFSQVGMGDTFTSNRFNGLLRKTVETVNQISPVVITALKCGANEIFKTDPLGMKF